MRPTILALLCLLTTSGGVRAEGVWELGLGLSMLDLPDYRGSDERRFWFLPLPYVHYHSENLRIEGRSARAIFWKDGRSEIDLSLAAAPPVNSDDNHARAGMPDLMPVLEMGVSWKFLWAQDQAARWRLRSLFPWRAVVASDARHVEGAGWLLAPGLRLDNGSHDERRWLWSLTASAQWASAEYHDYFYGVSPEQARPERPAWQASAGYSGSQLLFSVSRRQGPWWGGVLLRHDDLHGVSFADSPLLRQRNSWSVALAVTRILWRSAGAVASAD